MTHHHRRIRQRVRVASRARLRIASDERLVSFVRGGDPTAFEILYDRHCRELLSFCRYMLGSRDDAEDALQATFASAYRALLADERRVDLRPWLFTIARNACLSILRQRQPVAEVVEAPAHGEDLAAQMEQREDLRQLLATVLELPERQRASLLLAELHGLSHSEIGALLGVRAEQVRSYVYLARSNLTAERLARGTDCHAIREELAMARGSALLKSRLRRHLRSCQGCRDYAEELSRQRRALGGLIPVAPSLALKRRALESALGKTPGTGASGAATGGASAAAPTGELAGGGLKALVAKALTGVACLSVGTGAATLVLPVVVSHSEQPAPTSKAGRPTRLRLAASVRPASTVGAASDATPAAPRSGRGGHTRVVDQKAGRSIDVVQQGSQAPLRSGSSDPGNGRAGNTRKGKSAEAHGKSAEAHGKSAEAHGKAGEAHGKAGEAHGKSAEARGKSGEARGKSEEPHSKAEEAHGKSEEPHSKAEEAHGKSEEPHGKAEEAHTRSEEARGKAEEPHGK